MKVITIVLILGLALYFFIKRKNKPERYILRQGKATKTDAVFKAWTSGNLKKMLNVLNVKTNPIDRHYLLQGIVNETYKLRQQGQNEGKMQRNKPPTFNRVFRITGTFKKIKRWVATQSYNFSTLLNYTFR